MEQQDLELFNHKFERVLHQLSQNTFSFLDSQSLINSLTVSKDFYDLLNKYFKSFLSENNLIDPTDLPAPDSIEEDHYLKLFRSFYTREVLVGTLSNVKQSYAELQLVRYPRCSTYGVKDFSLGSKFAVFHLFNNDIIFLKSEEYLNPLFNMKNINTKNIRKNVTKFSTNAKDLFYTNTAGHLHTIFYNSDLPSHELTEGVLDLTISHPLKDFEVSYIHAILLLRGPDAGKKVKPDEEQKEDKKRVIQDVREFYIQNITPEEFNAPHRIHKIEGIDDQDVSSLQVGNNMAYFITDNYKIYELDFAEINNEKYSASLYKALSNKMIRKIWGGYNHFFVLEQNEIGSIDTWTQTEIVNWVNSYKDFQEFANIIKYENISGTQLLAADKSFLVDRLGMMREDLQVKFLNDIQRVAKKTFKKPKIYAWGNNTFGQLGINTGHVNVNFPHEVLIPELAKDDNIVDIKCGWKASVIVTHKGQVYVTEVLAKKAQKEKEKEKEEEEDEEPSKKKGKGKGKRKESQEVIEEKKVEKALSKWFDLTPTCSTLKDGRQYQVIQVCLNKENIAILGAYLGKKKRGDEEEEKAGSKFKGSDHVYHRILWDKKFNKEEFSVGYEDRFLGILEIPFVEFNLKTDIPMHRIKFFKRNGEIVWDRVQKTSKL